MFLSALNKPRLRSGRSTVHKMLQPEQPPQNWLVYLESLHDLWMPLIDSHIDWKREISCGECHFLHGHMKWNGIGNRNAWKHQSLVQCFLHGLMQSGVLCHYFCILYSAMVIWQALWVMCRPWWIILFFLPYYSILVFSKFLPIILIILPNILFIMPIIPSLNTTHRAPNRFLLYR